MMKRRERQRERKNKVGSICLYLLISIVSFSLGFSTNSIYNKVLLANNNLFDTNEIVASSNITNDTLDVIKETNTDIKIDTTSNNNNSYDYVKGIWIVTAYGIDFPKSRNPIEQKNELDSLINIIKEDAFTDVYFQVRSFADAMYKSNINPVATTLNGIQSFDLVFDPLEYLLDSLTPYGIRVHAGLSPFRVTNGALTFDELHEDHFAKNNKETLIEWENCYYYNPESEKVQKHLKDTLEELCSNYSKLSSIYFDDYFYPEKYMSDSVPRNSIQSDVFREAVNKTVLLGRDIAHKYNMDFGVTPAGIWQNQSSDINGSATRGNESYHAVYADTRKWVKEEMIDYIIPQVYWTIGFEIAPYDVIASWWDDVVNGTDVKLYIGQAINKNSVYSNIKEHLLFNDSLENINGNVFFSFKNYINGASTNDNNLNSLVNKNTDIIDYYDKR